MPNCDFFATQNDLEAVLDFVFETGVFTVYEAYSRPEEELRVFNSTLELANAYSLGACRGRGSSVLLQLHVEGSGPITIERFALNPRACNGKAFRYRANGWGLIQLQLGGIGPKGLVASHTNHNSVARALSWESTYPELGPVSTWNWSAVQAASNKLNRFIRKLAVYKDGSRPVLAEAASYLAAQ
ncbi:hypothetical protein HNQ51_002306 [Inhella inkyongensis]|uniref:Uncharacterized protein n=1 Tax=Inhella inkyongensis TaxID=392593 RepID=A0A840S1H4_9BURK|nr:hypothetical protein [Inhella inkyongensis]MBB5204987.1 hypothetical protein [Inhella inkyongensis]